VAGEKQRNARLANAVLANGSDNRVSRDGLSSCKFVINILTLCHGLFFSNYFSKLTRQHDRETCQSRQELWVDECQRLSLLTAVEMM